MKNRVGVLGGALLLAACGSSGNGPSAVPSAVAGRDAVSGVVGWDENADGTLDASEGVRFGGAKLTVGDRTATADEAGRFSIADAPAGRPAVSVDPASLPPYFVLPELTLAVPGQDEAVALRLPIGSNRPHVYMAFGDSLSFGVGSSRGSGFRDLLAEKLRERWGRAEVVNEGISGTRSDEGAARIAGALRFNQPAWSLIWYGTNDWNHACRQDGVCPTIPSLRAMVREAKAASSLPVLATLLPTNPGLTDPTTAARAGWLEEINNDIRALALSEGVPLADPYAAFRADRDPARLWSDDLHPNDRGYAVVAEEFARAITGPRGGR